jgi:flagellar assembly protein FliH
MSSNPPASGPRAALAEPFVFAVPSGESGGHPGAAGVWQSPGHTGSPTDPGTDHRAYEQGLAAGEARARATFEKGLAAVREQSGEALREFVQQRELYFQRVEGEIVQLALSIARKILHREAQIDPLLLTGIVRVALGTLNHGTRVRLRAHPQEIGFWRDYFGQAADIAPAPELLGDASLASGCCVLETDLGNTQISLETQLKEIEQGFLDLLEQRPRVRE